MRNLFVAFCLIAIIGTKVQSQEINVLLKEADNLEKQMNEQAAFEKYKLVILNDAENIPALVKATELATRIGSRATQKNDKKLLFETALSYAQRAVNAQPNNADALYALSMASGKMTEVETENKKIVGFVKDIKTNADKALQINANHAKANFSAGKWHLEMVNLNGFKKAAVKVLYGGLPPASLDSAIYYFEKAKTADPYLMINYAELAKAYAQNNQLEKQLVILKAMVRLPIRTFDDKLLKEEAQKQLNNLQ